MQSDSADQPGQGDWLEWPQYYARSAAEVHHATFMHNWQGGRLGLGDGNGVHMCACACMYDVAYIHGGCTRTRLQVGWCCGPRDGKREMDMRDGRREEDGEIG